MKLEPLKNKIFWAKYIHSEKNDLKQIDIAVIQKRHVKSAVEWLKKELLPNFNYDEAAKETIEELINEAFQDITREER